MVGFSLETACQRKKSLVLFLKAWWHYCDFPFQIHSLLHLFFSALTVFNCLSHWKKKKGGIHLMISNPWDFQNKAKPFLFNLWFVSQNFCLLVFLRLGCSETVLDISHAYITDWCPCFWPNLRFGLSCNSSQLYMNVYSF